jgi:hypothetical protein
MPKSESAYSNRPPKTTTSPIKKNTSEEIKVNGIDRVSNSRVVATSVLPERHDPDGGEDGANVERQIPQPEESEEDRWSDWETKQVEEEPPAAAVVPLVTSSLTITATTAVFVN